MEAPVTQSAGVFHCCVIHIFNYFYTIVCSYFVVIIWYACFTNFKVCEECYIICKNRSTILLFLVGLWLNWISLNNSHTFIIVFCCSLSSVDPSFTVLYLYLQPQSAPPPSHSNLFSNSSALVRIILNSSCLASGGLCHYVYCTHGWDAHCYQFTFLMTLFPLIALSLIHCLQIATVPCLVLPLSVRKAS